MADDIVHGNVGTDVILLRTDEMLPIDIDNELDLNVIHNCEFFLRNFGPNFNLRLYKTRNGHKVFITNKKLNIKNNLNEIKSYFSFLNGDRRYIEICSKEYDVRRNNKLMIRDFFHTRIVPKKDFRISSEIKLIENFIKYQKDPNIAICRYINSFGNGEILDDFKKIIKKHDYITKAFNKNSTLV